MKKPKDPRELAIAMTSRSNCAVQVGAVIADKWGIYAWGANHSGFDGLGCHAEVEAIRRANRKRLKGSTIYIAAVRKRNKKAVTSKPCPDCEKRLIAAQIGKVVWRANDDSWIEVEE